VQRREPVVSVTVPAFVLPQPPAAGSREPEGGIHIRHLDVQILNEEPRKLPRRPQPTVPPQESAARGFERYYIREVM
jgi:hypothetical protein